MPGPPAHAWPSVSLLALLLALPPTAWSASTASVTAAVPPVANADSWQLGRELFEQYAPQEIAAHFAFPSPEHWDTFAQRLNAVLQGESISDLADLTGEARVALRALRSFVGYDDVADWLEQRLDEMEGARQATTPAAPPPRTAPPPTKAPPQTLQPVPHYDVWLARVRDRPLPKRSDALMPRLRAVFIAEGVPPELAWIAEAESSLNPSARSPVGAKGLFQFMPETAKDMGLRTSFPDERTDPEKSARAAARYLRTLHDRFGNWALTLAAYNAGQGRVARTLESRKATTFTAIADALPAETRMYVPKVCALITTRTGVTPNRIPAPRK